MSLKKAIEKLNAAMEDLSTLEVTTYTGTLEQAIDADSGAIDWDRFTPTSGTLKLAAATLIRADYDTVNFRAEQAGIDDIEGLIELHQRAVESAQNGRLAILEMFRGLLGGG